MSQLTNNIVLDSKLQSVIQECMNAYGQGDENAEWPNNILSTQTVIYNTGLISKKDTKVEQTVAHDEVELCLKLATEAEVIMQDTEVGMGSESSDTFNAFYFVAEHQEKANQNIDKQLIQKKFSGTLFPGLDITVEPLQASGEWWNTVLNDGEGLEGEEYSEYFTPWKTLISWFDQHSELSNPVFISLGSYKHLWSIAAEDYPPGTEMPRLF